MSPAYTPGPWKADTEIMAAGIPILANGVLIASAWNKPREESNANARLIASAPALLEALQECIGSLEDHIYKESKHFNVPQEELCPCTVTTIKKARLAIAQATGGEK